MSWSIFRKVSAYKNFEILNVDPRLGFLPWKYLNEDPDTVRDIKMRTSLKELCSGLHQDFYHLLDYARGLKFDQEPDYDYCLALMDRILEMNGSK